MIDALTFMVAPPSALACIFFVSVFVYIILWLWRAIKFIRWEADYHKRRKAQREQDDYNWRHKGHTDGM